MTQKTLDYDVLDITPADIYEQMGYRGALPDEAVRRETDYIIKKVRARVSPQYCYTVVSQLPPFNMGTIIPRQLHGSEAYAVFVCTAGAQYEAYQQQLTSDGDMVRVFIADALGSVIAEKCADQMEHHLQESIGKLGWHHTNRYSPGYCGWPVSEQQRLFPLFGDQTCGVRLTDSSLMVPVKSVSGIIGLGPEVRRLDYTCGLCDFEKCYKRKLRRNIRQG